MLEIGAASGYNLSLYPDKFRLGIEPSAKNCALAKKYYGVDMFNGMFEQFISSNKQTFDLIFMSHVLEHIVDPMTFINECVSICNKYMFIEVPCFDVTFIDEPYGFFSDEHVNVFTLQSLWNLMDAADFSLVDCKLSFAGRNFNTAGVFSLVTLWSKDGGIAKLHPINDADVQLSSYLAASEKLWRIVAEKIDRLPDDERLALWGVGNYMYKLLGATSLPSKNIVRLYDADQHKHGHKICGVSVTAFDRSDVESGAIDAILITTCTAQRAIKRFLDRLGLPIKLYTLHDID